MIRYRLISPITCSIRTRTDEIRRFSSFSCGEGSIARLLLWLHNLDARQGKSLKSGVLIENARVWKGVSRFIRNTFIVNPSFVGVTQKVNRAKLINDENVLKRMSFLLTAVIQLPVDFVAWTANGTFYAVMDKKGGAFVECDGSSRDGSSRDGSSCNRCASWSAVRAGRRFCCESA